MRAEGGSAVEAMDKREFERRQLKLFDHDGKSPRQPEVKVMTMQKLMEWSKSDILERTKSGRPILD